jgi:hypothetical protein
MLLKETHICGTMHLDIGVTKEIDCVQKMTRPEGGEDKNDSAGCITSLNINSTDTQTTADEGSS